MFYTSLLFFPRRINEQLCILFCYQYHSNHNFFYLLPAHIFHHNVVFLLAQDLQLHLFYFKKRLYFFVQSLTVFLVTFTPSCCQRWFCVWKSEKPSSGIWIALVIIFESCSINVEPHFLQRYLYFTILNVLQYGQFIFIISPHSK